MLQELFSGTKKKRGAVKFGQVDCGDLDGASKTCDPHWKDSLVGHSGTVGQSKDGFYETSCNSYLPTCNS